MSLALKIILLIASIILTISILLQSSNSAGLSGSIGGGADEVMLMVLCKMMGTLPGSKGSS